MSSGRVILVLAVVLWALSGVAALWGAVAAYVVAWLVVNALRVWRPEALRLSLGRGATAAALVLLLAVPVRTLWGRRDALIESDALSTLIARDVDRYRLERTPSVFPPMVYSDHPQLFYVFAPDASTASLRVGPDAQPVDGTSLGHGLFRMRYDPRREGEAGDADGPVDAELKIDGATTTRELTLVRPRPHPRWLRLSPSRLLAATTSEETDEVFLVNHEGLVRRVVVGDGPADCVFLDDHRLAVSHRFDDDVIILDVDTGVVLRRVPLAPLQGHVAASRDGSALAVVVAGVTPGVFLVNTADGSAHEVELPDADWLAFGPDARTLLVSRRAEATLERWILDGEARQVTRLALGRPVLSLATDSSHAHAIIATTDYRADGQPHLGNHFVQDQLLTLDVGRLAATAQQLTTRRTPRQSTPGDVDSGISPLGIDLLDDGAVRVAFGGSDEVILRRGPTDPAPQVVSTSTIPLSAPHGVATFADGSFAVSSPSDGRIGVFSRSGELRVLVALAPTDDVLLRESPEALKRRMGERTFYEGTRAGISCQSCHPRGGTDRVLRNIGEHRLGQTLSARGLAGTAPFLRDGSYGRIRELNELAETLFRGYLRRRPGRALTLEAYVESLPRSPSRALFAALDLARERRGLDAFVDAGCASCHALPAFTNLGQIPITGLFPPLAEGLGADAMLDVPSLLTVGRGGPFFGDGRAADLEAVLRDENADDLHGHTAALGDTEVSDMVFFLRAL